MGCAVSAFRHQCAFAAIRSEVAPRCLFKDRRAKEHEHEDSL
jgi:hypothetical protein